MAVFIVIALLVGTLGLVLLVVAGALVLKILLARGSAPIRPPASPPAPPPPVMAAAVPPSPLPARPHPPLSALEALAWLKVGHLQEHPALKDLLPLDPDGRRVPWTSPDDQWWLFSTQTSIVLQVGDPAGGKSALKLFLAHSSERCAHYRFLRSQLPQLEPWLQRRLVVPQTDTITLPVADGSDRRLDILLTPWVDGDLLHHYLATERNSTAGRARLVQVARKFRVLTGLLRQRGFAHGDLCPRNICVFQKSARFELKLVDLDSFGPFQQVPMLGQISGHPFFQNPARLKNPAAYAAHPQTVDIPSEFIIYLSLLAYAADDQQTLPLSDDGQCMAFDGFELADLANTRAVDLLWRGLASPAAREIVTRLVGQLQQLLDEGSDPRLFRSLQDTVPAESLLQLEAQLTSAIGETIHV